jgi:hypothetical protein
MYIKQIIFVEKKFPEQPIGGGGGGGGGGGVSSIKNSLRAKFKSLKHILSSWSTNLLLKYICIEIYIYINLLKDTHKIKQFIHRTARSMLQLNY